MLVQFSVENFLSFNQEQVLSMVAGSDLQHPNHIVRGDKAQGGDIVRSIALYGPNASGKSNLIEAIRFARELIVRGTRRSQPIPVRPFKLGQPGDRRPAKFEFIIRTQGVLYNYGFRVNSPRVLEEWLYATADEAEERLFTRSTADDNTVKVEVETARSTEAQNSAFYDFLAAGTRPNQLFLTEAAERNAVMLKPVNDWFENVLHVISAEPKAFGLEVATHRHSELRGFLAQFLHAADTGIKDTTTRLTPADLSALFQEMPEAIREELEGDLSGKLSEKDDIVAVEKPDGGMLFFKRDERERIAKIEMLFQHAGFEGNEVMFGMDEESDGTQRLIHLVPAIRELQTKKETVFLLDELDRRFHPHLSRLVVQTALDHCRPELSNQFLFTTHDTNLLDLDLLRQDEIWFVEKDKRGASHLYSLAEFKMRPDLKIEKGYLNGRFGAIPFITPVENLGWEDGASRDPLDEPDTEMAS